MGDLSASHVCQRIIENTLDTCLLPKMLVSSCIALLRGLKMEKDGIIVFGPVQGILKLKSVLELKSFLWGLSNRC